LCGAPRRVQGKPSVGPLFHGDSVSPPSTLGSDTHVVLCLGCRAEEADTKKMNSGQGEVAEVIHCYFLRVAAACKKIEFIEAKYVIYISSVGLKIVNKLHLFLSAFFQTFEPVQGDFFVNLFLVIELKQS
jgi:hypothetical protein